MSLGASIIGTYRICPDDFFVEEKISFDSDREGSHSWLYIEKVNISTGEAVTRLAKFFGVKSKEIGYAGKKDTVARVRQWISVPLANVSPGFIDAGLTVLEVARGRRKLKIGQLLGNRFELQIQVFESLDLKERLEELEHRGVPNYFGLQRFGRKGQNLITARRLAYLDPHGQRRLRPSSAMAASAARSAAFNAILGRRVMDQTWLDVGRGDVLMPDGRRSYFVADIGELDQIKNRLDRGELSPTAPLAGCEPKMCSRRTVDDNEIIMQDKLLGPWLMGIFRNGDLRSVRIIPKNLEWSLVDSTLTLIFELPKGAYATALLNEIGELAEAHA